MILIIYDTKYKIRAEFVESFCMFCKLKTSNELIGWAHNAPLNRTNCHISEDVLWNIRSESHVRLA